MLELEDEWVWDFWLADDGLQHHLFFLHAPKSLHDVSLRHRAARIGHAVSDDLASWARLADVLGPGEAGDFDETATWTGSVVQGDDGVWRMFYTGARFLADFPDPRNVETVGVALSTDLTTWTKCAGPLTGADPRWYETLGTSTWPEEAWRDPWVYRDDATGRWTMLVTARRNDGPVDDRGVLGRAVSDDLVSWVVTPPLVPAGGGFQHLEVPQLVRGPDGSAFVVFSCSRDALSEKQRDAGVRGGVWAAQVLDDATLGSPLLIAPDTFYAGRVTHTRDGRPVLLAVVNQDADGAFVGVITDPMPLRFVPGALPHVLQHSTIHHR